jgi:hypothetical protein
MIKKLTVRSGLAMALVGLLAGCGSSQPGRTSGGVATGAGTGAVIGIIGGPIGIVVGAAVGAGAGALTATNTTPQQVNLGDPLWSQSKAVNSASGLAPTPNAPPGSLPPPQPLAESQPSGEPVPSQGAVAMPQSAAIQSQQLAPAPQAAYQAPQYRQAVPAQQPTQLTPPPAQNYQYQAQ